MEQNTNEPCECPQPIWTLISVIVITGLIVGGGIYLLQKSAFSGEREELEGQIQQLQNQINQLQQEDQQDPYKDWLTYRNEEYGEYGFEVKYPENWTFVEDYQGGYCNGDSVILDDEKGNRYRIVLNALGHGLPFDWEQTNEDIEVNGIKATKSIWRYENKIVFISVAFKKNDRFSSAVEFVEIPDQYEDKYFETYNQIISTFKFIN